MERKIIQIAMAVCQYKGFKSIALCNDGTLWTTVYDLLDDTTWRQMPPIPQPEPTTAKEVQSYFTAQKQPGENVVDEFLAERGEMKHWAQVSDRIRLEDKDFDRVLSIKVLDNGAIRFREECDGYYSITLSPTEAIKALEEAIAWIKKQQEGK